MCFGPTLLLDICIDQSRLLQTSVKSFDGILKLLKNSDHKTRWHLIFLRFSLLPAVEFYKYKSRGQLNSQKSGYYAVPSPSTALVITKDTNLC